VRVRPVRACLEVEPALEAERADLDGGVRLDVPGEERLHDAVLSVQSGQRLAHAGIHAPLGSDRLLAGREPLGQLLEHRRQVVGRPVQH
jgi:hypothetical protein